MMSSTLPLALVKLLLEDHEFWAKKDRTTGIRDDIGKANSICSWTISRVEIWIYIYKDPDHNTKRLADTNNQKPTIDILKSALAQTTFVEHSDHKTQNREIYWSLSAERKWSVSVRKRNIKIQYKNTKLTQHVRATCHSPNFGRTKVLVSKEHRARIAIRESLEMDKLSNNLKTRYVT